jgi:hypothetical protein
MGLDITAYKNVELIDTLQTADEFEEKYDWKEQLDWVSLCTDYPDRLPPIQLGGVYRYQDKMKFRAGSYSGYGWWRSELCKMAHGIEPQLIWDNPETYAGLPFVELINFSDCEGILGTEVCKKLLDDFVTHQLKANQSKSEYFKDAYANWLNTFEYAADNGYIDFH